MVKSMAQAKHCASKATSVKRIELQQSHHGRAKVAKPPWQGKGGKATMAEPGNRLYIKDELLIPRVLLVLSQLCFGSRRANLGMPGDLVIQERLVALK